MTVVLRLLFLDLGLEWCKKSDVIQELNLKKTPWASPSSSDLLLNVMDRKNYKFVPYDMGEIRRRGVIDLQRTHS